jgi:hypothetical protein
VGNYVTDNPSNPGNYVTADNDATGHVKGDTLSVPESVASEWERTGYVERVTGKS